MNENITCNVSNKLIKRKWSQDEDTKLLEGIELYGSKEWPKVANHVKSRDGKQCRERWINQFSEKNSKLPWTAEEENVLRENQKKYGNKWKEIQKYLQNRSTTEIKNHWQKMIRKESNSPKTKFLVSNQPIEEKKEWEEIVFSISPLSSAKSSTNSSSKNSKT